MTLPTGWVVLAAFLALVLGVWLMFAGWAMRRRRGLGSGKTVSLDRVTLTSRRLGFTGRPDRIIKENGSIVIEEWKSARRIWPNHRAQMGVYFLLVEEQFRIRPTHGFIVSGDGSRHRVDNTEDLRGWVLSLAGQIRAARAALVQPIPVNPQAGQCRACGQRDNCGVARR